jgi:hypothetical protein
MKTFWQSATVHRIAIAFLVLFSINSLCCAALGVLTGMKWAEADTQAKVMAVISIMGTWTTVLLAFFRDALAKIFKGEPVTAIIAPPPATATSGTFEKLPETQ